MLRKLMKEPLVHFLVAAALLFPIYTSLSTNEENVYEIKVSLGRIAELGNNFEKSKSRPPLPEELESLIQAYAINQMFLREARNLKLDLNDSVIDRRLRQKMEFLMSEMASLLEPSEEELKEFYEREVHRYLTESKYTFEQVFLSEAESKQSFHVKLEKQEARIAQGEIPLGDSTFLPLRSERQTGEQVRRVFGAAFAEGLERLTLNIWTGPITSSFGVHFVKLIEREEDGVKSFDMVRRQVLSDWRYMRTSIFKENYQKELASRYSVNIDNYDSEDLP